MVSRWLCAPLHTPQQFPHTQVWGYARRRLPTKARLRTSGMKTLSDDRNLCAARNSSLNSDNAPGFWRTAYITARGLGSATKRLAIVRSSIRAYDVLHL